MDIWMIFANMAGFDSIIVVVAIINIFLIWKLRRYSNELYELINPTIYMPIERILKTYQGFEKKQDNLHYVRSTKENETKYYNLFISVTNIFPLLGILGTVISLLQMIGFSSTESLSHFTAALTSTFWGLVFVIIFKGIDGIISSKIETNSEVLLLLFNRIDTEALKSKQS